MSKSDFARAINRSPARVSEWVNGKRIPDPASCDIIADALNIDLDVVLFQAGHRPSIEAKPPDERLLLVRGLVDRIDWSESRDFNIVVSMLRQISADQKRQ